MNLPILPIVRLLPSILYFFEATIRSPYGLNHLLTPSHSIVTLSWSRSKDTSSSAEILKKLFSDLKYINKYINKSKIYIYNGK